jgi:hypothetical protein
MDQLLHQDSLSSTLYQYLFAYKSPSLAGTIHNVWGQVVPARHTRIRLQNIVPTEINECAIQQNTKVK